jgi:hypothetical protein
MNWCVALPIHFAAFLIAALLSGPFGLSFACAQALGPDEAQGVAANAKRIIALTPSQKTAIYGAVLRQRLRTSGVDIPMVVGAPVPPATPLLALPDEAAGGEDAAQFLKYAMVDGNVVLVDSISMRVIDIIRGGGAGR